MGQFKNRRLDSFGPLFFKLTKHSLEQIGARTLGGEPLFKFDAGSHGAAINLAMQIRQYWNSARDAQAKGELGTLDPLTPLVPLLSKIAVRHPKGTSTIEIIHREQMASHKLLASALGELDKALAGAGINLEPQLPQGPEVDAVARALTGGTQGAQEAVLEQVYGSVRDERPHSPPAIDSYEEGLAQVTGWPGAKVRQQPGVYTRVGQRVYFSCTIMLRKQRTK